MTMLPVRHPTLPAALQSLDGLRRSDAETWLQAHLLDGSVVEGRLVTLGEGHLSLALPSEEMAHLPVDQIAALAIGVRRPVREFLLAGAMILGVTTILVGAAAFPPLRAQGRLAWVAAWTVILAYAGIMQLRRRTALGRWLMSWRPLYGEPGE